MKPSRDATLDSERHLTPCMFAFREWWADNAKRLGIDQETAWQIFRAGWWKCEDYPQ